jgi:hypothetical protein
MHPRSSVVRAVLSGTYKRDLKNLHNAYDELIATGCQVLSPHSLTFVSEEHGFRKTVHEARRSYEELERHHLFAVAEADFVWLHAPNGYIGTSAAMEIGFATASDTPVFSRDEIEDPAIAPFVKRCNSVFEALCQLRTA